MRQALLATLLAPFVIAATPVLSADLRGRAAPPQDYYSPTPVSNWQGFYLGLNGGIGFGSFTDGGSQLLGSATGGLIGFTGGYNYMVAPNLLIGLEGDFDFSGMRTSQLPYYGFATSSSIDDLFTIRGRVGYPLIERWFTLPAASQEATTPSLSATSGPASRVSNPPSKLDGRWAQVLSSW